MNVGTLIGIVSTAVAVTGLILSRIITRRVRVKVHRAFPLEGNAHGPECYYVNVTNLSHSREVEVTHVWLECSSKIYVLPPERPLPKRLKGDETWETWVPASKVPLDWNRDKVYTLARVRISSGKVFRSKLNRDVPSLGIVPGDPPQTAIGTRPSPSVTPSLPSQMHASRAIDLLQTQTADPIENLRHDDPGVYEWETITHRILEEAFGPKHRNVNHFVFTVSYSGLTEEEQQQQHVEWVRQKKGMLRAFVKELQMFRLPVQTTPDVALSSIHAASNRLRFGETMHIDIGTGRGHEAFLIAIHNVERSYQYKCHGIKAELTFTHSHSKETFKQTGWFAWLHEGRIADLVESSVTLDSRDQNQTWLIVYVNSNLDDNGQYWFAGPQYELSPLMAQAMLSHSSQRLSFGSWQVKVAITSDGDDKLERLIQIQAE